jgi:hypothetical protein
MFIPTVKRTITVSNKFDPSTIGWINQNNGKLVTTDQLISIYGTIQANNNNPLSAMPTYFNSVLPKTLPSTIYDPITGQPAGTIQQSGFFNSTIAPDGIVYFVGWLQYPSEYQTISLSKIQISQQWVFNKWSASQLGIYDDIYGTQITLPFNPPTFA